MVTRSTRGWFGQRASSSRSTRAVVLLPTATLPAEPDQERDLVLAVAEEGRGGAVEALRPPRRTGSAGARAGGRPPRPRRARCARRGRGCRSRSASVSVSGVSARSARPLVAREAQVGGEAQALARLSRAGTGAGAAGTRPRPSATRAASRFGETAGLDRLAHAARAAQDVDRQLDVLVLVGRVAPGEAARVLAPGVVDQQQVGEEGGEAARGR